MSLSLRNHSLVSQNSRVEGFLPGGDETSHLPSGTTALGGSEKDELIEGAYRQLFFHTLKVDRQRILESQLRSSQISVREFVRGLALSPRFLDRVYSYNGNKQVARHLVERLLGRQIHGEAEAIAWSIVIGERGVAAMVDALLSSEEYQSNFGEDSVPQQRQRILPGRSVGSLPTNITLPRYEHYYRQVLASFQPTWGGGFQGGGQHWGARPSFINWPNGLPPENIRRLWLGLIVVGSLELLRTTSAIITAMLSS